MKAIDPIEVVESFNETSYGFQWGKGEVTRLCSDRKRGWVVIEIAGKRRDGTRRSSVQVEISKTGKMRIFPSRAKIYLTENSKVIERKVGV